MSYTPYTWKSKKALHDPFASLEEGALLSVEQQLSQLPPLVQPSEIDDLRRQLVEVAEGRRFIIQGGDCAETFADCNASSISAKLKILLQMSLVISWAGKKPTLRIGRMAGQYAKPRTADTEMVTLPDGTKKEVSTFKGDCVNDVCPSMRDPQPERLVKAYFHSAAVLNHVRSLLGSGFADIHQSRHWQLQFSSSKSASAPEFASREAQYRSMAEELLQALSFMETCGVGTGEAAKSVPFFTSHEALVLPYEAALTRQAEAGPQTPEEPLSAASTTDEEEPSKRPRVSSSSSAATANATGWYNTSAHMLWIGERTRQPENAHVEYCRGIENPIGVKVGPTAKAEDIISLLNTLNPKQQKGKVILITRVGAGKIESLRPLVQKVRDSGLPVIWQCDPMHGNTHKAPESGLKTRSFDDVLRELLETATLLREEGLTLGGVHLEMTGEDVTECLGGPQDIQDAGLIQRYETSCDPRLNYSQSLEIAFRVADFLRQQI